MTSKTLKILSTTKSRTLSELRGYFGNPITKTSVLEWYKYLNHQGHEGSDTRNEEYGFIKLE
jgi:hypothetical protein